VLQLNPCIMKRILDIMVDIFSPFISSNDFYFLSRLCLNKGFEIFEVLKDLGFFPKKVNPYET
jgi:hypothetical protein